MSCEEYRDQLPDHLDDLLDPGEAARIEEHLRDCAPCARRVGELSRARTALFARPEVGPPPSHLRGQILAAAASPRRPLLAPLLRYAAVFLAGAGAALAFSPGPRTVEVPVERVVVVPDRPAPPAEAPVTEARVPRRIR